MALRHQLETAFKAVDTDKTGYISKVQLEKLLNKLNPDLSESDLGILFAKLDTTGGNVKFVDFIDLFCPKPAAPQTELKRELSKAQSDEETAALKKAFDEFDKDKSGYIDLKELAQMCTSLGKKISDEQAAAAMQQLDKNGDGKVTFDEFALWWTCTPGLGGYNHVVLGFLKGKLALQSKMSKTFSRVVRKKLDNTDEFSLKANLDIAPEKTGTKVVSSACMTLNKKKDSDDGPPCIVIKIGMKTADSAANAIAAITKYMETPEMQESPFPSMATFTQEGPKIVATIVMPEEMFDEDAAQAISFLQDAAKQVELKFGSGTSFEEVLANPNRPLCQVFKGAVFGADALVGLTSLVGCSREEIPEQVIAGIKCLGGLMLDTKLNYNQANLLLVAQKLKAISKMPDRWGDTNEDSQKFAKVMCKGIANAREVLYGMMEGNAVENGKWSDGAPIDTLSLGMKVLKHLAEDSTGIESVSILRLPGSTVEMVAKIDKINPFPMIDYFFGHLPKPPPGYSKKSGDDDLKKPISADEETKLKAAFDKYDKDKSGKIDLKELKGMLEELGAKVGDDEVEEGMQQLDTNGDGTCSFDEFKDWWSSKSSCGGYSSYALSFMKSQMKVSSMLGKIKAGISSASGHVGRTDNPDDTYVKFVQEVTPGMIECQPKMSVAVKVDKSEKKTTDKYQPELSVKFAAKSDADAKKAAEQFQLIMSAESIQPMYEMMSVPVPKATANESVVTLSLSPPAEMVQMFYEGDESADFLQVASVLVKAVLGSSVSLYSAVDFNDILADPDSGIYSTFGGMKCEGQIKCTADGKSLALDAIKGLVPITGAEYEKMVALPIELAKLFQSLDLTYLAGYHKENVEKASKHVEEIAKMTAPSATREMMAGMAPPFDMMPEEMVAEAKKTSDAIKNICDALDSITSISVDGVFLPGKEDLYLAVTGSFTNMKCFEYYKYMSEPLRKKLEAA